MNRTAARNGGQRGGADAADAEPGATDPEMEPRRPEWAQRATPETGERVQPPSPDLAAPPGPHHAGEGRGDTVVLTLPASSAYLSVLRTATAGLAARLQFTLDEIEDLRIAVDEACAMLLDAGAGDDAELTCRFELSTDRITVTVSVPAGVPALPSRDTFAWQVLTALAGAVEAAVADGQLTIQLTKRRGHIA